MEIKDLIYAAAYAQTFYAIASEGMLDDECDYYAHKNAELVSTTFSACRQKEKDPGNEGV